MTWTRDPRLDIAIDDSPRILYFRDRSRVVARGSRARCLAASGALNRARLFPSLEFPFVVDQLPLVGVPATVPEVPAGSNEELVRWWAELTGGTP